MQMFFSEQNKNTKEWIFIYAKLRKRNVAGINRGIIQKWQPESEKAEKNYIKTFVINYYKFICKMLYFKKK